jgi:hypothetical protein
MATLGYRCSVTSPTHKVRILLVAAVAFSSACAAKKEIELAEAPAAAVVPADGCATIREEFFADPQRLAEKLPTPRLTKGKLVPSPIPRPYPRGVIGRDGKAEIIVEVMVDTMGKADMSTFTAVKSTHPYLTRSLRNAVSKWSFEPAERRGCKVPRVFHFEGRVG